MYIKDVESDVVEMQLSVVEMSLLAQACGQFTVKNGTDAEQALVEAMGAGFHGAAMAASSIDVLLVEDAARVQRQWRRKGLARNADGTIPYPTQSLAELQELVGSDVYLDGAGYEAMGVVLDVASNGVIDSSTGTSGAVIEVGIDALVELEETDEVTYEFSGLKENADKLLDVLDTFVKAVGRDGITIGKKVKVTAPDVTLIGIVNHVDEKANMISVHSVRGHGFAVTVGAEYVHVID